MASNLTDIFNDSAVNSSMTNSCVSSTPLYTDGIMTKAQLDLALFLIYQIFVPVISLIGITGNILGVIVLFQTREKTAFSVYLKALTISDIFILCCGMLQFLCHLMAAHLRSIATLTSAYCQLIISFGIGNFLWNFSSSIITIMSVQRFVAIAFPFRIRRFFLKTHPRRVIAALLVIQVILRTPSLTWTEIVSKNGCGSAVTVYYLDYRDWSRDLMFRRVFYYFLIVWDMIIPVTTVIVMNIAILVFLKRRPEFPEGAGDRQTRTAEHKITVTLLVLSTFYVVSVIPHMTLYLVVTLGPKFTLTSKEYYLYSTIINTNILMVLLNSANDFFIYILASNHFRSMFKTKYFGRWKPTSTQEFSDAGQSATVSHHMWYVWGKWNKKQK